MLLYYLFWMFMGFTKHFYIIFGTNLLTQSPVSVPIFSLFLRFVEKEYQTESKRNETFGRVIFGMEAIQETWSRRQGSFEEATKQGGAPPTLVTSSRIFLHRVQVYPVAFLPKITSPVDFVPFRLHLIFLFFETLK